MKLSTIVHACARQFAAVALFSFLATVPAFASDGVFSGEYSTNDSSSVFFHLAIEQHGSELRVAFDAGRKDGQGAAPEGSGSGTALGGKGEITFHDDAGNTGTGTLERSTDGAILTLRLKHTVDARSAEFYAKPLRLKQTSNVGHLPR